MLRPLEGGGVINHGFTLPLLIVTHDKRLGRVYEYFVLS